MSHRLTNAMLDAMLTALCELEAGEGPQGCDEIESERLMAEARKAQEWIHEELHRRRAKANYDFAARTAKVDGAETL